MHNFSWPLCLKCWRVGATSRGVKFTKFTLGLIGIASKVQKLVFKWEIDWLCEEYIFEIAKNPVRTGLRVVWTVLIDYAWS